RQSLTRTSLFPYTTLFRSHNRRRKNLLAEASVDEISRPQLWWGLVLLGFTSLYREGFEVVLFLQSYHLRLGGGVVLKGALLGLRSEEHTSELRHLVISYAV